MIPEQLQQFLITALEFMAALFILAIGFIIVAVVIFYVLDVSQTKHAIRRNYPVIGRFRGARIDQEGVAQLPDVPEPLDVQVVPHFVGPQLVIGLFSRRGGDKRRSRGDRGDRSSEPGSSELTSVHVIPPLPAQEPGFDR